MKYINNNHLKNCLNHIKDMMIWIGSDGKLLYANASALDFYGLDLDSIVKLTIHDIDTNFPPETWPQHWDSLKRNKFLTVTVQHQAKSGDYYPVELIDNYQNEDGYEFSVCIIRILSQRKERDLRMQLMEFSLDHMLDSAIWIDENGSIIFANDSTCQHLGYAHDELVTLTVFDIDKSIDKVQWPDAWKKLKTEKKLTFETNHIRKDGHLVPVEVNINFLKIFDKEINCAFIRDTTERKLQEQQLIHMATHDVLTGLPNRGHLNERAKHAILHAKRDKTYTAILLIDLDKFKFINDNIGHDAGDEMLKVLSERMVSLLRATDTVARIGGDEFVILLDSIKRPEDCSVVGKKLLKAIAEPIIFFNETLNPGASIGISIYPIDGDDVVSLLKNADVAMYEAKRSGGHTFHFYKQEMGDRASNYMNMVKGLELALSENQFVLHYQPIFDMQTRNLVSAEALIRWRNPERGMISPLEFIPIAEESGLIILIGTWVIDEICRQNNIWKKEGFKIVPIAANLSVRQLKTKEIVDVVKQSLSKNGLSPKYISLELTESVIMDDIENVNEILHQFRALGVIISIDDFGTGYSSLNYLQELPVDIIKIDRSFIKDINSENGQAFIANTIVTLAHNLGCKVLAEGIETKTQDNYMKNQGCDLAQGFLYSKAIPAEAFESFLIKKLN